MDVGPFESMTAQAFAEHVPQTVEFAEMVQPTGVLKFSGPMRSVQLTVSTEMWPGSLYSCMSAPPRMRSSERGADPLTEQGLNIHLHSQHAPLVQPAGLGPDPLQPHNQGQDQRPQKKPRTTL